MNWLNYHHLYYFWTVARLKSFTKASEELRVAQSAVSHQVSLLEDFLDKKLLLRSTSKRLALSEEGQVVFAQADEIFRQGRELVDGLRSGILTSTVRGGAMGSLSKNLQVQLLRPILDGDSHQVSIESGDASSLLLRLKNFQLDFVLCDVPYSYSDDEPLIQRQIAKERYCFVAQPAKRSLTMSSRLEGPGIYLPSKSNPATPEIERYLNSLKLNVKIKGYIDDIALLRLLALETDSVVATPKIGVIRELAEDKLVVLHEFKQLFQKFYLVLRHNSQRSEKILQLLEQS